MSVLRVAPIKAPLKMSILNRALFLPPRFRESDVRERGTFDVSTAHVIARPNSNWPERRLPFVRASLSNRNTRASGSIRRRIANYERSFRDVFKLIDGKTVTLMFIRVISVAYQPRRCSNFTFIILTAGSLSLSNLLFSFIFVAPARIILLPCRNENRTNDYRDRNPLKLARLNVHGKSIININIVLPC
ncbi:hypothetical protein PUN28_017308 [Cardiocondyla obscurior]|uniref:Uncharacterized protein n=1 Tax=Cardiocondyla obscurior TaxID=286306 RepID=A0AAW2ELB4_9HYME